MTKFKAFLTAFFIPFFPALFMVLIEKYHTPGDVMSDAPIVVMLFFISSIFLPAYVIGYEFGKPLRQPALLGALLGVVVIALVAVVSSQ